MSKASDRTIYDEKTHRVIALVDDSEYGIVSLAHAFKFARIFRAELCVVDSQFRQISEKLLLEIDRLNASFSIESRITIHTPFLSGKLAKTIHQYAEEVEAMILVMPASRVKGETFFTHKTALKLMQKSRIPCVVTGLSLPAEDAYKSVVLPLDSLRLCKEKSLWAGYFSRFYDATVHVLVATYQDDYLKDKLLRILNFTEKIYANLEIDYKIHEVGDIKQDIDEFALAYAPNVNGSLLLVMTTRYFNVSDLLFGPSELNVIANAQNLPVMCINQRDDLYVLCT